MFVLLCNFPPHGTEKPTIVQQVLTPEECEQFIKATEILEYTEAPITTGRGPVMMTGTGKNSSPKDMRKNGEIS